MTNTSATGGYLAPAAAPTPAEGPALNDVLQAWIVGITGLAGDMVRPVWQAEPPNIPDAGTAWCAFWTRIDEADTYPFVGFDGQAANLQRHERIRLLCSFYDLGESGRAWELASLMRDGTAIAQNREPMLAAGIGLVGCSPLVALPSLFKERWLMRVDLPIDLRRQVDRSYPVLSVLSAKAEIDTDVGYGPISLDVSQKP